MQVAEAIDKQVSYHDRPEISRSMLATFAKSPRQYEAKYITKTALPEKSTDALVIGGLTHQQLLEPNLENIVTIIPEEVLSSSGSRAGKAWKEFEAAHAGRALLKRGDYETAMAAVDAVRSAIGKMIDHPQAEREKEIFWTDEETGIHLRAKLDLIVPTPLGLFVPDIKTCADLTRFPYQVRDGLWLQYAHYRAAAKAEYHEDAQFFFCVVEKDVCYRVRSHNLSDRDTEIADMKYRRLLNELARRIEANDFSEAGEGEITPVDIYWRDDE